MFQVDEVILYGTTGVCKIQDICEKNFGGVCTRYYILKPLLQETATVFVPTENKKLTRKMHPLLSPEDFQDLFHTISARTPVRPESEEERQQQFESVLQNGDRAGLMMMVHDLHNYRRE